MIYENFAEGFCSKNSLDNEIWKALQRKVIYTQSTVFECTILFPYIFYFLRLQKSQVALANRAETTAFY
jgi:hypothetical protein